MKIGFIGSGSISKFHIAALNNNGFDIVALGTKENSLRCEKFAKDNLLLDVYCKGGWREVIEREPDAFCLCIDTNFTTEILLEILNKDKPILVEKPISYKISDINSICNHKNRNRVFVGYNRRFYNNINQAKIFCDNSEGGTVYISIPDSKQGTERFLSNACHIIDIARYLFGDFKILNKVIKNNSSNEMEYVIALCSNQKWTISFNAHSLIPANFEITINSGKRVFCLKPIEKYNLYEGLEVIEPDNNYPLRRYMPKIISSGFENADLKPGFDYMYKQFMEFIYSNKPTKNSVSIFEAKATLQKCLEFLK
tara:strand:+ start:9494 stop:10426 length:933 start_codon:yes stop_codon:yes gene_type:complete